MIQILVIGAAFVCVACLVGGIALTIRGDAESKTEDRLKSLTTNRGVGETRSDTNILATPLDDVRGGLEEFVGRFTNLRLLMDQAGMNLDPSKLVLMSLGLGAAGVAVWLVVAPFPIVAPLVGLALASLPLLFVLFKRKTRLAKFSAQLPEALELISRALRAGHSLPAGIHLASQQISQPLGVEFARCYEEQNLGIPLEEAMEEMTQRVPNVDLRFFATSVILQRQTGGDLAEILDKISRLIRERFQIFGQIQALTGEGRLSGIVLLALPPLLFIVMLNLNYDYVMMLFEDPLGQKMLIGGIILQVIGALVIRKIINIKV